MLALMGEIRNTLWRGGSSGSSEATDVPENPQIAMGITSDGLARLPMNSGTTRVEVHSSTTREEVHSSTTREEINDCNGGLGLLSNVNSTADNRSNELAKLQAENCTMRQNLDVCYHELASARFDYEQLRKKLIATENMLRQERDTNANLSESYRKCNILLKSEQAQRKEAELGKTRCEALLEDQTARRLLGSGINIQGPCQNFPEIQANIRQALTVTVSEWVEKEGQGLSNFSRNDVWFIPKLLAHLFTLCQNHVNRLHQEYVKTFLGKVEGAVEDNMDSEAAYFMRHHLRRHHLTLFSTVGAAHKKACRCIIVSLGRSIADRACHDMATSALLTSGLEEITGQYLKIMASCVVHHPAVSFSEDCRVVQSFDKRMHFEPIDGDGDVSRGGQCMVIFPALLTQLEGSTDFNLASKRFVIGPQEEQAWADGD